MSKFQNIALTSTETTGEAFRVDSGHHIFAAGVTGTNTFPDSITLQMRFKDQTGTYVEWFDTATKLTADKRVHRLILSATAEYRLVASAAGATVFHAPISIRGS